jgi:RES domain-containing protein
LTRVYRILRDLYAADPFDGEGAFRYGGRWSSVGTRVAYASEHESLAILEYFVHLDPEDPPPDLMLATADVPDNISRTRIDTDELPSDWWQSPANSKLAAIGDGLVEGSKFCAQLVPSALATSEWNWLLNPKHPDFRRIKLRPARPLRYDQRLLRKSK